MQSEDTPMHVAALFILEKPSDASSTYLRDIADEFRARRDFAPPWSYKLKQGVLAKLVPAWVEDNDLDIDYHLRHSALPAPGGERELGILISRLHSHPLDMSRPLWEMHLVEGLENNRFAMYVKMHHSLIDGVSGMRLAVRTLSTDPNERNMAPVWTFGGKSSNTDKESGKKSVRQKSKMFASPDLQVVMGIEKALRRSVQAAISDDRGLVAPYASPHTVLSEPMNGQRRFATQQVEMALIKRLAKAVDGTVNDIVLYLCGTVLRRYMREAGYLPKKSLTAAVPVSLRQPGDESVGGNQISSIFVSLGTDIADPRKRLEAIKHSSIEGKRHLKEMPSGAQLPYTMITAVPALLAQIANLNSAVAPMFSVGISNVPGPVEPLYFNGARLLEMYPISLLMKGGALNITCVSCSGMLNFGFTGARDSLPHLQHMAVFLSEAVNELEVLLNKK